MTRRRHSGIAQEPRARFGPKRTGWHRLREGAQGPHSVGTQICIRFDGVLMPVLRSMRSLVQVFAGALICSPPGGLGRDQQQHAEGVQAASLRARFDLHFRGRRPAIFRRELRKRPRTICAPHQDLDRCSTRAGPHWQRLRTSHEEAGRRRWL